MGKAETAAAGVDSAWREAIEPGRDDGRLVAEGTQEPHPAKLAPMPLSLTPALRDALRAAGIEDLY